MALIDKLDNWKVKAVAGVGLGLAVLTGGCMVHATPKQAGSSFSDFAKGAGWIEENKRKKRVMINNMPAIINEQGFAVIPREGFQGEYPSVNTVSLDLEEPYDWSKSYDVYVKTDEGWKNAKKTPYDKMIGYIYTDSLKITFRKGFQEFE